jgi:transcriptional regulator NrdR family protein
MSNFICQKCGSVDSYTYDHRFSADDSWCEFYIVCNECGTRYTVDAKLIINRLEEE